jgi:hypothetical protein
VYRGDRRPGVVERSATWAQYPASAVEPTGNQGLLRRARRHRGWFLVLVGAAGLLCSLVSGYASADSPAPVRPFDMYFAGKTIPFRQGQLRLTRLVVIGTSAGERVAALCRRSCAGPRSLGPIAARAGQTTLPARGLVVTARTRLVVQVSSASATGRFKVYSLNPLAGSATPGERGCLAPGGAAPVSCAHGAPIELGVGQGQPGQPSCPEDPCLAIARTTGFQTSLGSDENPFRVTSPGIISGWSIVLAAPDAAQVAFFTTNEGGPAEAGISILRPTRSRSEYKLTAHSPLMPLQSYFGTTAHFSLDKPLPVSQNDVVALTVPTWAPALAGGLDSASTWLASRPHDACRASMPSSQGELGSVLRYACSYSTARLTYTATFVATS